MRTPLTHETAGTCDTLMNVVLFEVVTLADVTDVNPIGLECPPMDVPYSKGQSLASVKEQYSHDLMSKINAPLKVTLDTFMNTIAPGLDAVGEYTNWIYTEIMPSIHEGMWTVDERSNGQIPVKVQEYVHKSSEAYLSVPVNKGLRNRIEGLRDFIERALGINLPYCHLLSFPNPDGYAKYSPIVLHFIGWLELLRSTIESCSSSSITIQGHPRSYELNLHSLNKAYLELTSNKASPECPPDWFYLCNSEVGEGQDLLYSYTYMGQLVRAIPVALIKLHVEDSDSYKANRSYTPLFSDLVERHLAEVLPAVAARKASAAPSPMAVPYMGGNVIDMAAYRKSLN